MEKLHLEELAKRLGARAEARIDIDRTAQAVVERLRGEGVGKASPTRGAPARVVWWRRTPVLQGLAAAVVVLVAGVLVTSQLARSKPDRQELAAPAELMDLSVEELEEVYDSLALRAPASEFALVDLQDLDEAELEELLQLMEG